MVIATISTIQFLRYETPLCRQLPWIGTSPAVTVGHKLERLTSRERDEKSDFFLTKSETCAMNVPIGRIHFPLGAYPAGRKEAAAV